MSDDETNKSMRKSVKNAIKLYAWIAGAKTGDTALILTADREIRITVKIEGKTHGRA